MNFDIKFYQISVFNAYSSLFFIIFSSHSSKNENTDLKCSINKVSIEGCKGPTNKECKLKRTNNASIVIDYTPDFDADDVKLTIYSLSFGEKQWPGMNTNACEFTKCPIENGVANKYTYGVQLNPTYPVVSSLLELILIELVPRYTKC